MSDSFAILPSRTRRQPRQPENRAGGGAVLRAGRRGSTALALLVLAALSSAATAQTMPFGSHRFHYSPAVSLPTVVPQAQMDVAVRRFYDEWKRRHVVSACGHRAVAGGRPGRLAVSEGQGYGMIIAAVIAGYDPDAQHLFDDIFHFARAHPSRLSPYLMSWTIANDCSMPDAYPAADGDLDIAFALLLADEQWGSAGSVNYKLEAINTVNALKMNLLNRKGASTFVSSQAPATLRTSDFMPDHFRAFFRATGDPAWKSAIDQGYSIALRLQTAFAPRTGLVPDWIVNVPDDPAPAPRRAPSTDAGVNNQNYGWNACRFPLRIGADLAVSGDPRAALASRAVADFFRRSSGGRSDKIYAGYALNGKVLASAHWSNAAFQAPVAVAAMSSPSQERFLNAMWTFMANREASSDYYADSLQLLSMIVVSGNYWTPQ